MDIFTIENAYLRVSVHAFGAELQSIYSQKTGTEYLWQGDPAYWANRAPNLFPFIGRRYNGKYTYKGKEYESRLHGLAKYYTFQMEVQTPTKLCFLLTDNAETRKEYPFSFEYRVIYSLQENALVVRYEVYNRGEETLICSLGGHPAINVPFKAGRFEDYFLEFSQASKVRRVLGESDKNHTVGGTELFYLQDGLKIPLSHELLGRTILLTDTSHCVFLKSANDKRSIALQYEDFDFIAFWRPPDTDAPFLCLEPWSSLPAMEGRIEVLENKRHMLHIDCNKQVQKSFSLYFYE